MEPVTLLDWSARYSLRRGLCHKAAYFLARSVIVFDRWLGRFSVIADLDEDVVSGWVAWMETQAYSPRTRYGYRSNVLSLWRYLADEHEHRWPGRVRKAPKPEPMPVAWTLDELRKLRLAAESATGRIVHTNCPRSLYLMTLLDAAYESGLRRGDLWRLEQGQFMPNGIIILRQNKTRTPHEPQLNPDTLARVRRLPGKLPLRWPGTERGFYDCWRVWMLKPSGVRPGVLQQLRRSGATHLESIRPHETSRYLGHRSPDMKRHYVDRSQAYGPAPQPPRFWWEDDGKGNPKPPPGKDG